MHAHTGITGVLGSVCSLVDGGKFDFSGTELSYQNIITNTRGRSTVSPFLVTTFSVFILLHCHLIILFTDGIFCEIAAGELIN